MYRGEFCTEYVRIKTELLSALLPVTISPRVPLPPQASKQRAPSKASSLFAQSDRYKSQGWSLRSPLCPAADCGAKPDFQMGSWLQKPQRLHQVLCLANPRVEKHSWEQRMVPQPSAASQEAEHGCSVTAGRSRTAHPAMVEAKTLHFSLVLWGWNPPSKLLQLRWGAGAAAPPFTPMGSQPGTAHREQTTVLHYAVPEHMEHLLAASTGKRQHFWDTSFTFLPAKEKSLRKRN